jgi:hypothetical protein
MTSTVDIRQHATVQAYNESTTEHDPEHKSQIVSAETVNDDMETRAADSTRWGEAVLSAFIALLSLYLVAFAIAAYVRDGTLASSLRNISILQMSKFVCCRQSPLTAIWRTDHTSQNPMIFPILFTMISAKLIKSLANWKLERGSTVGHIQHLLGSRSLVSSVVTPIRIGAAGLFVPVLIMVWAMKPLGGQLSLRVVSGKRMLRRSMRHSST